MLWPNGELATCVVLVDLFLILLGSGVCRHRHCIHYVCSNSHNHRNGNDMENGYCIDGFIPLVNQVYDSIQYIWAYEI